MTRIDANRPTARPLIDGDSHSVELDLTPVARAILLDLGRALFARKATWRLRALGTPGVMDPYKAQHFDELLPIVRNALTLHLGPDQAEALAADLDDASTTPDRCEGYCDGTNYATIGALCGDCDEIASMRNALAGGRL